MNFLRNLFGKNKPLGTNNKEYSRPARTPKDKTDRDRIKELIKKLNYEERIIGPKVSTSWLLNLRSIRKNAAIELGKIKNPLAVEPLIAALKRDDNISTLINRAGLTTDYGEVCCAIIEALGKIGDKRAIGPLLAAWNMDRYHQDQSITEALAQIGKPAIKQLIDALKNEHKEVRAIAINALGKIGDTEAIEPLILRLKDSDNGVRLIAVQVLSKFGDNRAVEPLISLLKDKDQNLVMAAADALVEFKDNRVIEPLITILNDGDFHFGPAAARLLGKIKDDRVVDALISVLKDHHKGSSTRSAVARVLGEIMENQAVEPLIDILEDNEDMNIQIIAVRALGKFKDKRAVEPLINLLEDIQGEDTQGDNIKNDIFSASFNEELNKMVNEGKNNSRIILRAGAAEAMGEIKDKSAIKPLKAASKEHDYKISSKAAEALEKLRSK